MVPRTTTPRLSYQTAIYRSNDTHQCYSLKLARSSTGIMGSLLLTISLAAISITNASWPPQNFIVESLALPPSNLRSYPCSTCRNRSCTSSLSHSQFIDGPKKFKLFLQMSRGCGKHGDNGLGNRGKIGNRLDSKIISKTASWTRIGNGGDSTSGAVKEGLSNGLYSSPQSQVPTDKDGENESNKPSEFSLAHIVSDSRNNSTSVVARHNKNRTLTKRATLAVTASHSVKKSDQNNENRKQAFVTKLTKNHNEEYISIWPQMDALDKRVMKIAIPCIANFAINPLIGAVDLFWVNRMGNALAVAGQAAANQVFTSAFFITSFLPSVTATMVSKANAQGDQEQLQNAVSQALVVGFIASLLASLLMLRYPEKVLSSVLKDGAPALQYAKPYLFTRSFAFLPSMISLIGFSAFRGKLDTSTPLKVSAASNLFNAILDPILMFTFAMGVSGAALATLAAEIVSAASFVVLMLRRKMFRWSNIFKMPSWTKLKPLLQGGAALQLRNVALNVMFLSVARVTQGLDDTGVAAAAHALAIQTFQVGGIVLLALSVVAQTVIPNELIEKVDPETGKKQGGILATKNVVNRLMGWGFVLGVILGALQMILLPVLQKSSPLEEVKQAAIIPSVLASVYQLMNGMVFIGEGVMIGCGNFMQLSIGTIVSTAAAVLSLSTLPKLFGLAGVWMSFGVFNVFRLVAVWLHQTKVGPLSKLDFAKTEAS